MIPVLASVVQYLEAMLRVYVRPTVLTHSPLIDYQRSDFANVVYGRSGKEGKRHLPNACQHEPSKIFRFPTKATAAENNGGFIHVDFHSVSHRIVLSTTVTTKPLAFLDNFSVAMSGTMHLPLKDGQRVIDCAPL
jgi:hypothetical protein